MPARRKPSSAPKRSSRKKASAPVEPAREIRIVESPSSAVLNERLQVRAPDIPIRASSLPAGKSYPRFCPVCQEKNSPLSSLGGGRYECASCNGRFVLVTDA